MNLFEFELESHNLEGISPVPKTFLRDSCIPIELIVVIPLDSIRHFLGLLQLDQSLCLNEQDNDDSRQVNKAVEIL